MKFTAVIAVLMLSAWACYAQNRANIHGRVVDSLTNEPMDFATVAVLDLKDSSLVSYTLTVKGGDFTLHNLPSEKALKLVVSFINYKNFRKTFTLDKAALLELGNIKLSVKSTNLKEVSVTADITPVVFKKDTIEFSAEAFKTPPNAVVEELLKRLPGIQVDLDGTITVNGKKVTKLLIDGKQFFVNDPRIASRNLDAALIDKVQVYDDRDNDPDHLIPDSKVNKIINLKFKAPIKKSTFGKLHGGVGTEKRFDGGLLYNRFRDTLQVSLIGVGNNLNRTGFTSGDLASLGGFNRIGNEGVNGIARGNSGNGGIQSFGSGGVNINTDYGKKLKLNFLYYYSYTQDVSNTMSNNQQLFSDTTLTTNRSSSSTRDNGRHNISGLVEWNPDTSIKIRYVPKVNFADNNANSASQTGSFNNFTPLNTTINSNDNNGSSFHFQHSFNFYKKFHKKGASLTIYHDLDFNPGNGLYYSNANLTSYTALLPSSDLNRLENNTNNTYSGDINISYRYPFTTKFIGSISLNNSYNFNNGRQFTYNNNLATGQYDIYIDSLSHNLVQRQFNETIRPQLTIQINKQSAININPGVQFIQNNYGFGKNIADINRNGIYLLPSFYYYNTKITIGYEEYIRQPSVNELNPFVTVSSQLYSSSGNPNLASGRSRYLYAYYNTYDNEKMLGINFNLSGSVDENSTFSEQNVNSQGVTFSKPVNKSGSYYINWGGSVNKGLKKVNGWQVKFNTRLSGGVSHYYFQVNSNEGFQNRISANFNQQVTIDWNNKFDINPAYNINLSFTTYQNLQYANVKYVPQTLDVPIVFRWPKRTTFEAGYSYSYNPLVAAGYQKNVNIVNFSVARQFQARDRGEIKLSVYDLFDQNVSSYRYTSGNSTTDVQNQVLKRYFLLSYSYRFSTVVPKKKVTVAPIK